MDKEKVENSVAVYVLAGVLCIALAVGVLYWWGGVKNEVERVEAVQRKNALKRGDFVLLEGAQVLFFEEVGLLAAYRAGERAEGLARRAVALGEARMLEGEPLLEVLRVNKVEGTLYVRAGDGGTGWAMQEHVRRLSREQVARRVQQAFEL